VIALPRKPDKQFNKGDVINASDFKKGKCAKGRFRQGECIECKRCGPGGVYYVDGRGTKRVI